MRIGLPSTARRAALAACLVIAAGCGSDGKPSPADAGPAPADAPPADTVADLGPGPDDAGPDASPCGNGVCDFASETDANCPEDCGCAAVACAVGMFAPGGCACDVCCADPEFGDCCDDADTECGVVAPPCGNGVCDLDCEDSIDCAADCTCGDGACDFAEDSCICFADCCGDGFCDSFCEDASTCPDDC